MSSAVYIPNLLIYINANVILLIDRLRNMVSLNLSAVVPPWCYAADNQISGVQAEAEFPLRWRSPPSAAGTSVSNQHCRQTGSIISQKGQNNWLDGESKTIFG